MNDLHTLIEQINTTIAEAQDADGSDRLAKCRGVGVLLTQAKSLVESEEWDYWVAFYCDLQPFMAETYMSWATQPAGAKLITTFEDALVLYFMAIDDGNGSPMQPARDEHARMANGTWLLYNCHGLLAMVTSNGKVFDRPGGNRLDMQ